ncbi:MAG: cytidylyltransferase domain-containing protein [Verrucomicrobiota bacterium]
MKIVGMMPVRVGSRRAGGKSVRKLGGRALFCWMLEKMDALGIPVHVYASEVESLEKLVDFKAQNIVFTQRPEFLDNDGVIGAQIYKEFAQQVPADVYLLCHATSPFVKVETLRAVVDAVTKENAECALTVRREQTFAWFDGKPLNFALPRIQTQSLKPVFLETSGAYCYRREVLEQGDRSNLSPRLIEIAWPETEDIDTEEDFARCEEMIKIFRQN